LRLFNSATASSGAMRAGNGWMGLIINDVMATGTVLRYHASRRQSVSPIWDK
jgi:hypothetical protein